MTEASPPTEPPHETQAEGPAAPLQHAKSISSILGQSAIALVLLSITLTVLARAFGYHCAECDAPKLGHVYKTASLYFQVQGGMNLLGVVVALGALIG